MAEYTFGVVQVAAEEVRTDGSYFFDNQHRPDGSGLVLQLTIEAAAFYRDGQGEQLVTQGNAMLFSHAEATEYGYPPGATEPYRHQYIEFSDCQPLRTVFDKLMKDFGPIVSIPDNSSARGVFNEILERFRTGAFNDRYHESELLYHLLIATYREQVERTRGRDPIEFGYHYILNRFRYAANLKQIAEACGVTREYFGREFKRRYGENPGSFLRSLRVEHAKSLLKTTSIPIEEIAAASGFTDANAFGRRFKQLFGTSPGAFRERIRAQKQNRRPI